MFSCNSRLSAHPRRGQNRFAGKTALRSGPHIVSVVLEGCAARLLMLAQRNHAQHQRRFTGIIIISPRLRPQVHRNRGIMKTKPNPHSQHLHTIIYRSFVCSFFFNSHHFGSFPAAHRKKTVLILHHFLP